MNTNNTMLNELEENKNRIKWVQIIHADTILPRDLFKETSFEITRYW